MNETGSAVSQSHESISNETGADLTPAQQAVDRTVGNVSAQQAAVRSEVFTETRIEVTSDRQRISFADPLDLTGRVVSENGTPVPNGTIQIDAEPERTETRTNATGQFTLRYRPAMLPVDTDRVSVRYVPANTSAYLGSNTTVAVDVRKVQSTITISQAPERISYGQPYAVAGTVTVEGAPVSGIPVAVSLDGRDLGTVSTDATGFRKRGQLPPTIPSGDRSLLVRFPHDDRALAVSEARRSVTVRETPTVLRVRATESTPGALLVTGQLLTDRQWAVPRQPVSVSIQGTVVDQVRTSPTGEFSTRVRLPASVEDASTVRVEATTAGTGTNLAPASASTTVDLTSSTRLKPWDSSSARSGSVTATHPDGGNFPTAWSVSVCLLHVGAMSV